MISDTIKTLQSQMAQLIDAMTTSAASIKESEEQVNTIKQQIENLQKLENNIKNIDKIIEVISERPKLAYWSIGFWHNFEDEIGQIPSDLIIGLLNQYKDQLNLIVEEANMCQ